MTTLVKILVSALLSFFCCSCNVAFKGVKGQGEVLKKEKVIHQNFNAVKASRGLDVILRSNSDKKVIIEANQNLHDIIKVFVEDNTLYVTADENIYYADKKNVFVSYDKLQKVHVNSGASISSNEAITQQDLDITATSGADLDLKINAETVNTAATSGAMINIEGKVTHHNAKATSGANLRAKNLLSQVSEAKATSGASIRIYAKNEFTGKATSGSDIVYFGNPKKVSEADNSGGDVRRH